MKRIPVLIIAILVAIAASLLWPFHRLNHDPKDLRYWLWAGGTNDWQAAAQAGQPEAQFYYGASLLKTNMVIMISRVGSLYSLPVVGRRFFEKSECQIDNHIDPLRLAESFSWIKKSADQGFEPAQEAKRLFVGRLGPSSTAPK